jgi:hypothetical protein
MILPAAQSVPETPPVREKAVGGWSWQPWHFHAQIVLKFGSLKLLEPSESLQACTVIALPLLYKQHCTT